MFIKKVHLFLLTALLLVGSSSVWGAVGDITITIAYSDIPDGYTATTGTSGSFKKTLATSNDLTIYYSGINTKSSATANRYGYAMFLKNYGYVYSGETPSGYYPSKVTVTFGSNTGESGKAGITFGAGSLNTRNSSVSGSVSKSGTCAASNTDYTKIYWNFSTTGQNVQVDNIQVVYSVIDETKVTDPSFSIAGGTYNNGITVEALSTSGATIYYTVDGTTPTTSSPVYNPSTGIVLNGNITSSTKTTIKAFAVKSGLGDSDVSSVDYVFKVATPAISPKTGTYFDEQDITISTTTEGASLYYSTDGSSPSTEYSQFSISGKGFYTVRAIATKSNYLNSEEASRAYTIKDSRELTSTFDLSTASYSMPSSTTMTWNDDLVSIVADKNTSSSAINSYVPPTNTSTRFYKDFSVTISPSENIVIKSIVFTATTDGYATTLGNSSWTNGSASVNSKAVTITPVDGTNPISVVISGACGFTKIEVGYWQTFDLTISAAGYVTYYNADYAIVLPSGLEAQYVTGNEGNTLTLQTAYSATQTVPKETPILLKGNPDTYTIQYAVKGDDSEISGNLLSGIVDEDGLTTSELSNVKYYRLAWDRVNPSSVGFYYGADDGNAFLLGANKAYLPLSLPSNAPSFLRIVSEENTTTSVEKINDDNESVKFFVNGQLYIMRAGIVYDVLGREVKY